MKQSPHTASRESREILDDIRRLVQAIRLSSGNSEKDLGLSAAQLFVLHKLREENGLSINDLGERTLTHQSSVSVIVQKLEAKKLVKRTVSETDGRKFNVMLTAKGVALMKKAPPSIQDSLIAALAKMKPEMRRQFSLSFAVFLQKAGIKGKASMMFDDTIVRKRKK